MHEHEVTSEHYVKYTNVHRLDWNYRGAMHVHKWQAICSCGIWRGIPTRRKKESALQHREHATACSGHKSRRYPTQLRTLTPKDKLPEVLR